MRRALPFAALGLSGLFCLSTAAASAMPPEVWYSVCDGGPSPTCVSASASDAARPEADAGAATVCDASLGDARAILDGWAAASKAHLPIPEAERMRLRYAFPGRSGQEISLTAELQGPVDAADLARRYAWTADRSAGAILLTASPNDALERLFYDRFTVALDAATLRPVSICFSGANGKPGDALALKPWVDDEVGGAIHLAGFDGEHTAAKPIRTADLSDESPVRFTSEVPSPLPPLPTPCRGIDEPLRPIPEPVEAGRD